MFKIIPPAGNKGFVHSPFIAAALVILSAGICFHLMESESRRQAHLELSGKMDSAVFELEDAKAQVSSAALLSYLRAASSGGNLSDAETSAASADLTAYVQGLRPRTFSSVDGNFSLRLDNSSGVMVLRSEDAPRACINSSVAVVCAKLGVERVVDKRWML